MNSNVVIHEGPSRRLAIVLRDLDYSDSARMALELAAHAGSKGYDAQLWLLARPAHLAPLATVQGIGLHWLGKGNSPRLSALSRLRSMTRRFKPDILYCLGPEANVYGRLAARIAGTPLVLGSLEREGDARRQFEGLLHTLTKRIVLPAPELAKELPRKAQPRSVVILPGVDCERFAPASVRLREDAPRILCLGLLRRDGGQDVLLRAFALLLRSRPDARLMVVGDGPRRERLLSLARHLDVFSHLQFLPGRQDVAPLYHVARLVVLPALRMGAPRVALEAMASGVPVVAAQSGGIGGVVLQGETGLLAPSDAPQPLAEAMLHLLEDDARRMRMGLAARRHVCEHFSKRAWLQAHFAVFEELLASP